MAAGMLMVSRKLVVFDILMLVAGLDEDVDALGGVAVGGGTVVVVQETQEVGKGFDLFTFGFLIADFLCLAFGVVVFDAKEGPVIGVADFEFHTRRAVRREQGVSVRGNIAGGIHDRSRPIGCTEAWRGRRLENPG
jgi:hypothetical protein